MARIGVLALQGGFDAHKAPLRRLGHEPVEVRTCAELATVEGLVLPGGESTTHLKLLAGTGLEEAIVAAHGAGMPILATCAGMILAARRVPGQRSLGLVDIAVARNAYGRQVASFEAISDKGLPLMFIRAPRIVELGRDVAVLDSLDGEPILVRQGRVFATTFHPELTDDLTVHRAAFGGWAPRQGARFGCPSTMVTMSPDRCVSPDPRRLVVVHDRSGSNGLAAVCDCSADAVDVRERDPCDVDAP